jgi:hypothetical protein
MDEKNCVSSTKFGGCQKKRWQRATTFDAILSSTACLALVDARIDTKRGQLQARALRGALRAA